MKNVLDTTNTEILSKKPNRVYVEMQANVSSKSCNQTPVDRPRDKKQCSNAKFAIDLKKKLTNDEYVSAVELAIQSQNFVKRLIVHPGLVVHLADDSLLSLTKNSIQICMKTKELKQVVSYGTTFCLGDFYLSVLVGRNVFYKGDPIVPIAFMMHDQKYMKYHKEFLCDTFPIIAIENASAIPVVIDREKGLTACFKNFFPKITKFFVETRY